MPRQNRFCHQVYQVRPEQARYKLLDLAHDASLSAEPTAEQIQHAGRCLRQAGVKAIYLLHGTFVGRDGLGWLRTLSRFWPTAGQSLQTWLKRALNQLIQDAGNFTPAYAQQLQQMLADPNEQPIAVRLLEWSGENLHIARADAAVRLLDDCALLQPVESGRVLVWGHSHGGNALALLSNLLAAEPDVREAFFTACRSYYCIPYTDRIDMPCWQRVANEFQQQRPAWSQYVFDFVTLGTPIRYGWDCDGYGHLLHFINHRPRPGLPEYQAEMPRGPRDLMTAAGGDYVQQLGVAGTNLIPHGLSWRSWLAETRLHALVQREVSSRSVWQSMCCGARLHHEGLTLLVDYGDDQQPAFRQVAGHTVYTRQCWLWFHLQQIIRYMYK